MRTRGWFGLAVLMIGGVVPVVAGCTSAAGGTAVTHGTPSASAEAVSGAPLSMASAQSRSTSGPAPKTPTQPTPTGGSQVGSNWPWCQLSDVRFELSAATGGDSYQWFGSVTIVDVSGRTCKMSNFLIMRWRDAQGTVMPVTVTHINGPVPPGIFFVIRPGTRGIAGIRWQKYKQFNSTETCPPFAATLEIWLGSTLEDPHPEQRPPAKVSWFTGTTASICGGTVQLQPIERRL